MRRVRKRYREDALRLISAGEGNFENLRSLAASHFGHDVGYQELIKAFLGAEVNNAVSCLRGEGKVETIGKKWKMADQLQLEDVQIISTRRLKRLRGELKAQVKLAHDHGQVDEAIAASRALDAITVRLEEVEQEQVDAEASVAQRPQPTGT